MDKNRVTSILIVAALVSGCGGRIPGIGMAPLVIDPARTTMLESDTLSLDLEGEDEDEATWTSSDTTVVRVVGPGRVVGVATGRARVTATVGERSARSVIYVDRAVLVGAGDIAVCGYEADERTAELLDHLAGIIWTAGDNAYPSGTTRNFQECYEPTWGRHKDRTRPSPGNHEYRTPGAAGYFEYYGDAAGESGKGWYAYRYGGWLVLALNSNLSYIGPELVEEQYDWLRETLEENPTRCAVAYFHHPLFSSGEHGNNEDDLDDENMRPMFEILYAGGVDVALVGHDHHYERFAPMTPTGELDRERGVRQFLVGTGGAALRGRGEVIHPNSEIFRNDIHGVLELVLHEDSYEWQFISIDGRGVDSGRDSCH